MMYEYILGVYAVKYVKPMLFAFIFALLICLCGCEVFPANTYELLSPPELTGDFYPIGQALTASVGKAYNLRYPSGGDRRSAIVLHDIDGDERKEAFAFYSLTDQEMHINMIRLEGEDWRSAADYAFTAGGVERIDFCDLNSDGIQEIIVGWEMQTASEKQFAVYSYENGKLIQKMLQRYTEYLCCDLDADSENEIFVQLLNTTDSVNRASICKLVDDMAAEVSSCIMDRGVKSVVSLTEGALSNGQTAIYIEELKSSSAITEVLLVNKGRLINPLLEETMSENIRTARSSSLMCKDINHDGILEIPVSNEIISAQGEESPEKIYYTKWSSFNGETLVTKQTEIINQNDGYSMIVPEKWVDHIAVSINSERHSRNFYSVDAEKKPKEKLAALFTFEISKWDSADFERPEGAEEICRTASSVIVGCVYSKDDPFAITMSDLKKSIYLNN